MIINFNLNNALLLIVILIILSYLLKSKPEKKIKEKFFNRYIEDIVEPPFVKESNLRPRPKDKYKLKGQLVNRFIKDKYFIYGKKIYSSDPYYHNSCVYKYIAVLSRNNKPDVTKKHHLPVRSEMKHGDVVYIYSKSSWIGPWLFKSN